MVSVWCLFKCSFKFEVDPEYLHSCLHSKQTAKSLHTLVPIFQKPKYFHALLAPFGFFTKTLPSMLVTLKVENEAGWKFHLKVCQITHKSIFARGHNLRKKECRIFTSDSNIWHSRKSRQIFEHLNIRPRLSFDVFPMSFCIWTDARIFAEDKSQTFEHDFGPDSQP